MSAMPRSETAAGRRTALQRGQALPPATPGGAPGYPVTDAAHWDKARQAVGRVADPGRRASLAKLLRKTAPMVGRTAALGKSWAAPAGAQLAASGGGGGGAGVTYLLSETTKDDQGHTLTCPECGHVAPAGDFGASGASLDKSPGLLRTPAPGTGSVRSGAAVTVRGGGASHALANGTRQALELASGTLTARRHPIHGPMDVLVARSDDGTAVLRHRHGGAQIASLRKTEAGKWVATVNGTDLAPRDHQRTALMEAVGTWNSAVTGALHPASAPLQPPPQQTELMREYGIPAIRALATPATGAGAGPRITMAGGTDDGTDENGLTPKGQAIYKKLMAKGFPAARALAFAKNSQRTRPGAFGKTAAA
jgi:hypothetical protein